jgi:hypothetical protein
MADNIKRNIEEEKEFLRLQEQIRDAQKEAGKNLQNAGQYTKTILVNYREMQKVSSKIKDLEKEMLTVDEERAAIIHQQIEELKKERDQIKAINKEMASLGGVVRMGLSGLVSYLGQALTGYLEFSQKTRDVAAQIGLGSNNMNMLQSNIQQAAVQMAGYGVSVTDALEAQQAYSDELGRSVILTQSALENMSMIGKATGLGMQGMAGLTAQMNQFGLGAEDSAKMIYSMYSDSTAMGLNAGKVIKKFQENIGLLNKLNFKNGIKGLQKMAQLSEKYKIDMNGIANASEKAFSPEGAIEMAAQLQVMGGAMASLGDPFQLMYKARNNPEKFAEDMAKAAAESATFNSQTGEFQVNAMEIDRLRVVAEATGQSMENLVEQAKTTAQVNMFKGLLGGKGLSPEEQDAVAMMSQMVDGKAQIQIGVGPDGKAMMKDLTAVGKDDLQRVLNDKKSAKEAASQATGIMERIQNVMNQLMVAVYPLFQALEQNLQPLVDILKEKTTGWAESLKNFFTKVDISGFIDGLKNFFVGLGEKLKFVAENWKTVLGVAAIAFATYWVSQQVIAGLAFGLSAARGFKMGGGGIGLGGGKTPAVPNTTPGPGGPGSVTSGMNPMSMIKGAAAVLILSAALFVFAKALQEFDKLQNGWETLAMAGVSLVGLTLGLFAVSSLPQDKLIQGAIALALMGAAFIPLAFGLSLLEGISWSVLGMAGVAILGLTAAVFGLGALLMTGVGAVIFGAGILGFMALGAAMVVLGFGLSMVIGPLSQFMTVIGDGTALLNAGLAFLSLAAGIGVLTLSLIAMGAAAIFALPGLLILGGVTSMLTETATALAASGGGEGIEKAVNAINSVDQNKLDALKDLSMWFSLIGASPTIKFEENLTVDGSIVLKGEAGGKTGTDWINDPIFVSKLKELIEYSNSADRNGGKPR